MTAHLVTTLAPPRFGPAIRMLLIEWAPDEVPQFEREFRDALEQAGRTFDLTSADAVMDRWRRIAVVRSNPLTAQEQEQLRRAKEEGDFSGFLEHLPDGSVRRL